MTGHKPNKSAQRTREIYKARDRKEHNRVRKLKKHLENNPEDKQATKALN